MISRIDVKNYIKKSMIFCGMLYNSVMLLAQPQFIDQPHVFNFTNKGMGIDKNGFMHVAYGGNHLYYATNKTGQWVVEIADSSNLFGSDKTNGCDATISLDNEGTPYIIYRNSYTESSYLLKKQGGKWIKEKSHTDNLFFGSDNTMYSIRRTTKDIILTNLSNTIVDTLYNEKNDTIDISYLGSPYIGHSDSIYVTYKQRISYTHDTDLEILKVIYGKPGAWTESIIDSAWKSRYDGNYCFGLFSTVVPGPEHTLHVAYLKYYNDLYYKMFSESTWSNIELIYDSPSIPFTDGGIDILFDELGKLNIFYSETYGPNFYLVQQAVKNSGTWEKTTIDTNRYGPGFNMICSFANDNNGNIKGCFWSGTMYLVSGNLYYTEKSGTDWVKQKIDSNSYYTGYDPAIKMDKEGFLHACYLKDNYDTNFLKYANNINGKWEIYNPDTSDYFIYNPDLAIGTDSNVYISYFSGKTGTINILKGRNNTWEKTIIEDSLNIFSGFTNIEIDKNNVIHLLYCADYFTVFKTNYATNKSGSWTIDTLAKLSRHPDLIDNDAYSGLALDTNSNVHVAYANYGLNYAKKINDIWETEIADSNYCGGYISLALDKNNKAHILYGGGLYYTTNKDNTWKRETVNDNFTTDDFNKIIVDNKNIPLAFTCSWSEDNYIYRVNKEESWQKMYFDPSLDMYTSGNRINSDYFNAHFDALMDDQANLHIVYNDISGGDLRYIKTKNTFPTAKLTGGEEICIGDSSLIQISLTGTAPWIFSIVNGYDVKYISTSNPYYLFYVKESGVYYFYTLEDAVCNSGPYYSGNCAGAEKSDTAIINVKLLPEPPSKPTTDNLFYCENSFALLAVEKNYNTERYDWGVFPEEAGIITGSDTSVNLTLASGYHGETKIYVKGENLCGTGAASDSLLLFVDENPIADFEYEISNGNIYFTNLSNGNIYEWDFGRYGQSGAINPVIENYANDTFYAILTVFNGACLSQALAYIHPDISNMLNTDNANVKIFPNPATDFIYVNTNQLEQPWITITTNEGKVLFNKQCLESIERIDISDWQKGMYIISLKNKDENINRILIKD